PGVAATDDPHGRDGSPQREAAVDGQVGKVKYAEGEVNTQRHETVNQAKFNGSQKSNQTHGAIISTACSSNSAVSVSPLLSAAPRFTLASSLSTGPARRSPGLSPSRMRRIISPVWRPMS